MDGYSVSVNGDNAFPEDYYSAIGQIQDILDSIQTEITPHITPFTE